jgi:hypothetical protein
LNGALAIANWLQNNTYDTRGHGGYTGGYTASGKKIEWKSTEHNIDIYAFFTMLAAESGETEWTTNAAWAERFVGSMWDSGDGRFYVGTGDDGITPNKSFKPEDVNSWSYLAFQNPDWAAAPSWDVTNLAVTEGGFSGVSFCSGDRSVRGYRAPRRRTRAAQRIRRPVSIANLRQRHRVRSDEWPQR